MTAEIVVLLSPAQILEAAQNDEWQRLYWQMAASAPAAKRFKDLSATIRSRYVDHPSGETAAIDGSGYQILISARTEDVQIAAHDRSGYRTLKAVVIASPELLAA